MEKCQLDAGLIMVACNMCIPTTPFIVLIFNAISNKTVQRWIHANGLIHFLL